MRWFNRIASALRCISVFYLCAHTVHAKKKYEAEYLVESVSRGQVSPLRWADDESIIDPYAALVGLPKTLVPTVQSYVKQLGLMELFHEIIYENPCEKSDGRFYRTMNPHSTNHHKNDTTTDKDELLWYAMRPGSRWSSDMHWFSVSNERTHEFMLRMLAEGGFGEVLDAIGRHYELDSIMIESATFVAVSHCEDSFLHTDFEDVDGKAFNLLIPVHAVNGSGPELSVAGERYVKIKGKHKKREVRTGIKYDEGVGILVGDNTRHGTRECDHRAQGEIKVGLSVYFADLTPVVLEYLDEDVSGIFPTAGTKDFYWSQRGRQWRKDTCLVGDVGRFPFKVKDRNVECAFLAEMGECDRNPEEAREECPMSCNVYMDDEEYRPGIDRMSLVTA